MQTHHTFLQTMDFKTYDIRKQDIEKVIPQSQRRGIYVLHMADHTFYVGQASDVGKRYRQHCRNYPNIEYVSFKRVTKNSLDREEEWAIKTLESEGFHLLNIIHTSVTYRSTDFDLLMLPEQQKRWLTDTSWTYVGEDRQDDKQQEQRLKYRHKFKQFRAEAQYQDVVSLLKQYVRGCIPAFNATQFEYWSISCLPSTLNHDRYATVNMSTMETFVVGRTGWAFINIAASPFEETYPEDSSFVQTYPDTRIRSSSYDAAGFDQLCIVMDSIVQAKEVLRDPAVLLAARVLNLQLMRKRKVLYSQSHCFDLSDELVKG